MRGVGYCDPIMWSSVEKTGSRVACCSGCLSAFKAELLKSIMDDFVAQTFFGEPCTYSEDRHLTNLVLKQGYNVLYIPEAIAYTKSPETLSGFMRQQKRWGNYGCHF